MSPVSGWVASSFHLQTFPLALLCLDMAAEGLLIGLLLSGRASRTGWWWWWDAECGGSDAVWEIPNAKNMLNLLTAWQRQKSLSQVDDPRIMKCGIS